MARAVGEDLSRQCKPPIIIPLADRVKGLDQRDLGQRRPLVAEHLGHAVDLGAPALLVEQRHQPAGERGLHVPQLERLQVGRDGLVGRAGQLGDLAVQGGADPPVRACARRCRRPAGGLPRGPRGSPGGPGRSAGPPARTASWSPPPPRSCGSRRRGGSARRGRRPSGPGRRARAGRGGRRAAVPPARASIAAPGPGRPSRIATAPSRSRNAGRSAAGTCPRAAASLATAARAASPPSLAPVVQPGQVDPRARAPGPSRPGR